MAVIKVRLKGPLFDGRADEATRAWARDTQRALTDQVAGIVRDKAGRMNRSGRGGTGAAASGVRVVYEPAGRVSGGIEEGKFAWPWLEGVSERNQSTPFRGYHTFRLAGRIVRKRAKAITEAKLEEHIVDMGG